MKFLCTLICSLWMVNSFAQDFSVFRLPDPEVSGYTFGDFNGDDYTDIIAVDHKANNVAAVYLLTNLKESTIGFSLKSIFFNIPFTGDPIAGDMDGDGYVDVVYNNSTDNTLFLLKNDGTGTFTQTPLGVPGSIYNKAIDLDKDGDLDMVGIRNNPKQLNVYINNGALAFTATNIYSGNIGPEAFDIADFDNDGDMDILVGVNDIFNTKVFIYQNNGNGNYTVKDYPTTGSGALFNIYADDINKDGKTDILVLMSEDVKILENKGTLTFEEKKLATGDARVFVGARVVDLTGEGQPDIILSSSKGMQWYKSLSLTDYTYEPRVMNGVNSAFDINAVDFNNDGAKDAVTSNGSLFWYQNNLVQLPSSSDDFLSENTLIYPNPVTDEISFKDLRAEKYTITIYNTTGQAVLHSTVIDGKTNVATLHPGIYMITLRDANGNPAGQQKVIKL
ncbi:MAG: T9SS type A sorting domain-containing protein [Saprospiraceae bacterium]|nr:T9SS type A sorting domain-containing protein [Saprospiraceae bacterium]